MTEPTAGDAPLLEAFENRVRKRQRHLERWAKREGVDCYRVYDRDIPELACVLDRYGDRALLQQYLRAADADYDGARLEALCEAAARALEIDPRAITIKLRRKLNRREAQHEKTGEAGHDTIVHEAGARFHVNLEAYLDTGLFLDHRTTRLLVRKAAAGRRVLNLFCYTGSFSVQAALGGASATVSVDLSNTYLAWARRNFELNGMAAEQHVLARADVGTWLREAARRGERFGLVVLDPPAYSSSKKMDAVFDVQRDHVALLQSTAAVLAPDGVLFFSTNLRGFKLDQERLPDLRCEDITERTIPEDFRNHRIHQCWRITRR